MRAKNLKQRPALLYAVLGIGAMVLGIQYMAHAPMGLMTYDGLPADGAAETINKARATARKSADIAFLLSFRSRN